MLGLKLPIVSKKEKNISQESEPLGFEETDSISASEAKQKLKEAKRRERDQASRNRRIRKSIKAPRSVQSAIRYDAMHEDGICMVQPGLYSASLRIINVDYHNLTDSEQWNVFTRYTELLNYFNSKTALQITLINREASDEENLDIYCKELLQDDGLNVYRQEFNEMIRTRKGTGHTARKLEPIITIAAQEQTLEAARKTLSQIKDEVSKKFEAMGSKVILMDGIERLEVINRVFFPGETLFFDYRALQNNSLRSKDAIAPSAITVPKTPNNVVQYGNTYGRTLALKTTGYPSDLTDRIVQAIALLDCDLVMAFHLEPVDRKQALSVVNAKLNSMTGERVGQKRRAAERIGLDPEDMVSYALQDQIEDAEQLRNDLRKNNQEMFLGTFLVYVYADSLEKLNEHTRQVRDRAQSLLYQLEPVALAPEVLSGLNSILPLGKNHLSMKRTLTTVTAATFMPLTNIELQQKGGLYYGVHAETEGILQINRLASNTAAHAMVIGGAGSGKSFKVKIEMAEALMKRPNARVYVIDPDSEYKPFIEAFGGRYITIKPESNDFINPLEIERDPDTGAYSLAEKAQFLKGLCEEIYPTEPKEQARLGSIIERVVQRIYRNYLEGNNVEQPTIKDLVEELSLQPEEIAQDLKVALEGYATGTMAQFGKHSNVNLDDARITGFGLKEATGAYKATAQHIISEMLWNQMMRNKLNGLETWIYFDEFQTLIKSPAQCEHFLNVYARGRKFNAVCTAITQSPDTILKNEQARIALFNSPYLFMFNMQIQTELHEQLELTQEQANYISSAQAGHGFLRINQTIIPFKDNFPPETQLYKVIDTRPNWSI